MNLAAWILRRAGWKVEVEMPRLPKALVCVAPHTSNWDFILGKLAWASVGRKAGFLMKEGWFFFPLGLIFKAIGGIPVPRKHKREGQSLTETVINLYRSRPELTLAITPEGTRSRTVDWHTGFLRIAQGADVPIFLGVIDASTKTIQVNDQFIPTGDLEADMLTVKRFYASFTGLHPEKFSTGLTD